MKTAFKIIAVIFSFFAFAKRVEGGDVNVRRVVIDEPEELFSTCSNFYAKLKSPDVEDIKFVSGFLAGVPSGRYCVSNHVKFTDDNDPTMLLLHSIKKPNSNESGYIVCVVYPYKSNEKFDTYETPDKKWLQGVRRFDVWHLDAGKWKVVLGVDLSDEGIESWFGGNETVFSDDAVATSEALKLRSKVDIEVENSIISEIKKSIDSKNIKK